MALSTMISANAAAEMVLHRGNGSEPGTIDPQMISGNVGSNIARDLFEGLVAEDQAAAVVPGMAKKWNISKDGKTYTFYLRDAKWSNGDKVTAHDFVFAFKRAVDPKTGTDYSFLLYPIVNAKAISKGEKNPSSLGVKAIDDSTFQITLHEATPYFLSVLVRSVTFPVPTKVVKKHGKNWTKPEHIVSNGPFQMQSWVPQSKMVLVKSKTYWDKNAVKLDKVIFYPTEDQNSELKRFRAGELHWTMEVPSAQLNYIKKNLAHNYKIGKQLGTYYYGFNTAVKPFNDINLRKALSYAIDRQIIVDKISRNGEQPAYGFVVPGTLNSKPYLPEYATLSQKERVKQAKALYAKAGYSKSNPLKMELLYNTSENHKKIAVAIAAMWKQVLGVQVNMVNQEWKVYLSSRREKKTQVFRAGWLGDYNDPTTFLTLFLPNEGLNDVSFNSDKYVTYIKQANKESDLNKRAHVLYKAEKELIDSFSFMPIYFYVNKHLVSDKLKGYTLNVMDHNRSKYMYLVD